MKINTMQHKLTRPLFLLLTFALLSGCGGGPQNFGENREAALLVISRSGTVRVTDVGYPIETSAKLPADDFLVTSINLAEKKFSDTDLQKLTPLTELRELNLYGTQISDSGISAITDLQNLTELELSYTAISDEGLAQLTTLKNLKQLFLHGTKVTDGGIDSFKSQRKGCQINH